MTRAQPRRTLWRFLTVGAINTFAGLGFIYLARRLGMGEVGANATGYGLGLVLSFGLNRGWAFQHRGGFARSAVRFASVMLLAWLANVAALLTMLHSGTSATLAHALAVIPYATIGYFGCRRWVFAHAANHLGSERV